MRAGWAHQLARPTASLCHRSRTATPIVGGRPALALRSRPGRVLFALGPCSQDWVVPRWTRTMQSKGSAGIEWIREAPKIELHVHLDGAFSTDILWNLAKEEGGTARLPEEVQTPWSGASLRVRETVERALGSREAFREVVSTRGRAGGGLGAVLDAFENFLPLVRGRRDALAALVRAFYAQQAAENIVYSEARYAPHFLALQGSSLPDARAVVATVAAELRACHAAAREQGGGGAVLVKQILCCVNLSPELSAEVVRAAEEFGGAGDGAVVGVDLACGEHHFENAAVFAEHRAAMRRARDAGLGVTVHAGESGGAANVTRAIEEYHADRIGHGYSLVSDEAALAKVAAARGRGGKPIHLEICPTSAIATESVPNVAVHGWETSPLAKLLLHPALSTSVSSDDPSVMTCSLTSELELVEEGLGLGRSRAGEMARAAIDAAFCTDSEKEHVRAVIDAFFGDPPQ